MTTPATLHGGGPGPVAVAAGERVARYDRNWSAVVDLIRHRLAAGEKSLSRVLRQVEADWRRIEDLSPVLGTAAGRPVEMPFAALIGGRQALWRQVLLNSCRPDTGLVVELGAGWGNNLLDLFTGGGPLRATYAALEPTSSGREALTLLARLDRKLKAIALDFDYRSPSYGRLPRAASHALVFTSHSVEQVAELPYDAITGLMSLAPEVTVVHFEPIGWQMREREGLQPAEQGATLAYAEAKNYNRNLWPLLRGLEAEGRIAIREAIPDIFCHKPVNASSLVIWEKLHAARGQGA